MGYVTTVAIFLAGVLAAANIIVSRKPDAKQLIDKITPYQGWIGILNFLWGVWFVIYLVLHMGVWLKAAPLYWIVYLATSVVMVLLGFILGFGLITKYALSKSPAAMEKGQQMREKIAKFTGPLGILAIIAAIASLVVNFI